MKFENKVALVTGGSRGIGAAIATRLAAEGASVAITYARNREAADAVVSQITKAGGKGIAIHADNSDAKAVTDAVNQTARDLGGLDILVNNAGIGIFKPLTEFSVEEFDQVMAINVRAVFVGIKAAALHMKAGGRIITIGSTNSERMPFAGGAVYAMSKAAIVGLTKGFARDFGPLGITINNVQPGPVDTELNPANGPFAETLKGLMAIPRFGHGDEIAAMVSYLASEEAAYVTGASLLIDGGFAA